jgi:hypothetical protein
MESRRRALEAVRRVYINESGYKDVAAARPAWRCLDCNIRIR